MSGKGLESTVVLNLVPEVYIGRQHGLSTGADESLHLTPFSS